MSSLIRNSKDYPSKRPSDKHAFVLCGFGGSIWQLKRLISVLNRDGYNVRALDFSEDVLSKGDPELLPALTHEVVTLAEARQRELNRPVLLVGVSLGALMSVNVLRRSKLYDTAVLITGGDIVKVAQRLYGPKVWPQAYDELASIWQDVNMYTEPALLRGKHALMVLPTRDKLIDPEDVRAEVEKQQAAGNDLQLLERGNFGHLGTIVEEAVLFPKRTQGYVRRVAHPAG